jgi:hypothetical protein
MFGNLSPQAPSDAPNGYRALAYAAQQVGCSIGGHVDAQVCPTLWNELRLWQDANHDGVAQPDELHTLESRGVQRISLEYHESWRTDQLELSRFLRQPVKSQNSTNGEFDSWDCLEGSSPEK